MKSLSPEAEAERFARVRKLFDKVADLAPGARAGYLRARSVAADIVSEVEDLVEAARAGQTNFARPIADVLGSLATDDVSPGDQLGAWRLQEEIGRGGMGKVFRAQRSDGHYEQRAALKVLRGIPSRQALEHLARERQILAGLSHPNIARLIDGGATPRGQPYLVMDFVEGVPLDAFARERKLARAGALRLFLEICDAVSVAHRQLIVHCDLKPANILVEASGRPVLLDFGIARLHDTGEEGPDGALAAYTPRYASPEQLANMGVTTVSDVFSLGRILGELVVEAPPELAAIVARATKDDPAERYGSVDALASDVRRFLEHRPVDAMPRAPAYVARKFAQRNWLGLSVAAVFVGTVAVSALRVSEEHDRAKASEQTATQLNAFLLSIFENPDLAVLGSPNTPAVKIVDAAHVRVERELAGQPEAQSAIYGALGSIYGSLGRPVSAIEDFDRAIAIERKLDRPLRLARLLNAKVDLRRARGETRIAEPEAREALALREKFAGPDSVEAAESNDTLARVLTARIAANKESEDLFKKALTVREKHFGVDSLPVASTHLGLAILYNYAPPPNFDAERHLKIALDVSRRVGGERHPLYIESLEALATRYAFFGRPTEGEALWRQAVAARIALHGPDNDHVANAIHQLGRCQLERGHPVESIASLRQSLAMLERIGSGRTTAYALTQASLGISCTTAGDYACAESSLREGTTLMRENFKRPTGTTSMNERALGEALLRGGKAREAGPVLAAAYAMRRELSDEAHYETVAIRHAQAWQESLVGRAAEANARRPSLERDVASLSIRRRLEYQKQWGLALAAQGCYPEALAELDRTEAEWMRYFGDDDLRAWLIALDRATVVAAAGRKAEAARIATMWAAPLARRLPSDSAHLRTIERLARP